MGFREEWVNKSSKGGRLQRAAILFATQSFAAVAYAGTPVSWVLPVSGGWSTAQNWSPQVVPTLGYDVTIGATGAPYTVTEGTDPSVDSLTLSSPDATLKIVSHLDTPALNVAAGRLSLSSGSRLLLTRITGGGGVITAGGDPNNPSFDRVTVASDISVVASSSRLNFATLALDNGTLRLNGNSGTVSFTGGITGNGVLELKGTGTGNFVGFNVGTQLTVRTAPDAGWVNLGRYIYPNGGGPIANFGTIAVSEGQTLVANLGWSSGTLVVNNGTLIVETLSPDNFGTVVRNGGRIVLAGAISRAGGTVDLANGWSAGPFDLDAASIDCGGGTLASTGRTVSVFGRDSVVGTRIARAQIAADMDVMAKGFLQFSTCALSGSTIRLRDSTASIQFGIDTSTLGGSGTIVFDSATASAPRISNVASVTLGSGITIQTGLSGGSLLCDSTLTNNGALRSQTPGKALSIVGPVTNGGLITAASGATISMNGAVNNTGTIAAAGGTVTLGPTVVNTGTLTASAGGWLSLGSATLTNNGTIRSDGGRLVLDLGRLSGTGPVVASGGTLQLAGNMMPSDLDRFATSNDAAMLIAGTLNGSGAVLPVRSNGRHLALTTNGAISNATLTGAVGDTLSVIGGFSTLTDVVANVDVTIDGTATVTATNFTNNGTLIARNGGAFVVSGTFQNNGLVAASSQSGISFATFPASVGSMTIDDGWLSIRTSAIATPQLGQIRMQRTVGEFFGTKVNNVGAVLVNDPEQATWWLGGGTITGGRIDAANGGTFGVDVSGGTLSNVTLAAPTEIHAQGNNNALTIDGSLHLDNSELKLYRTGSSGVVRVVGNATIDGSGTITAVSGSFSFAGLWASDGTCTIGQGVTLRNGPVAIGVLAAGTTSGLVLHGNMICNSPAGQIQSSAVTTKYFYSDGLVRVSDGAGFFANGTLLNISSGILSGGRWEVFANSTLSLGTSTTSISTNAANVLLDGPNSTLSAINNLTSNIGTFSISNGRNFSTIGALFNSGTFAIGQGSALRVNGSLDNSGTVDVSGAMLIDYSASAPTPIAVVGAQIAAARNGGLWDRPGITSTRARLDPQAATTLGTVEGSEFLAWNGGTATFSGFQVDSSSVLVKYTWNGDANLDGRVTFDDYVRIDTGFNTHLTAWSNGDFNYDGVVNFDDYVLIDIAFNAQNGTLARAMNWISGDDRSSEPGSGRTDFGELSRAATGVEIVIEHFDQFGTAYGQAFLAAVPEPSAFLLSGLPALATIPRRRHPRARPV